LKCNNVLRNETSDTFLNSSITSVVIECPSNFLYRECWNHKKNSCGCKNGSKSMFRRIVPQRMNLSTVNHTFNWQIYFWFKI